MDREKLIEQAVEWIDADIRFHDLTNNLASANEVKASLFTIAEIYADFALSVNGCGRFAEN